LDNRIKESGSSKKLNIITFLKVYLGRLLFLSQIVNNLELAIYLRIPPAFANKNNPIENFIARTAAKPVGLSNLPVRSNFE